MSSRSPARLLALLIALVGAGVAAQTTDSALRPVVGYFACYQAQFRSVPIRIVRTRDVFGTRSVSVGQPLSVCSPATVGGRRGSDSRTHLTCNSVAATPLAPRQWRVTSMFGTLAASVVAPSAYCAPSSAAKGGVLSAVPTTIDSYTCYSIKAAFPSPKKVSVADEFGTSTDTVTAAASVCIRASTSLLSGALACYSLDSTMAARSVIVASKFGLLKGSLGARTQVCVRSLVRSA
ncbi:MAG TPA: hypothetical protein VF101_01110 [Gaiellaceae bacterium]